MTERVVIEELNCALDRVTCERSVAMELYERFSFESAGAAFDKRVKFGMWDGMVRLFNLRNFTIYGGLRSEVVDFLEKRGYEVSSESQRAEVTLEDVYAFYETLGVPGLELRENQAKCVLDVINRGGRGTILSPTGTGKSLIIYVLYRWYDDKTILMVPRTSLAEQMKSDFRDYGATDEVISGIEVTTWQSTHSRLKRMGVGCLDEYRVVFGDEAHNYQAKSLAAIMEAFRFAPVRVGTSGTLSGAKVHEMTIVGLFGPVISHITTMEAVERGELTKPRVLVLILEYSEAEKLEFIRKISEFRQKEKKKAPEKRNPSGKFSVELDFILDNARRNEYLIDLTIESAKNYGNIMALFDRVESHGHRIKDSMREACEAEGVLFNYVHGGVKGHDRESTRKAVIGSERSVTLASTGTFSTGINVPNLHRVILLSPFKSVIKLLQSIGRGLRLHETKDEFVLVDVADDLRVGNYVNYGWKHLVERLGIYADQGFEYKILRIKLQ